MALVGGTLMLKVLQRDEPSHSFAYRICPGRHLSQKSLFMAIASILHVFEIKPKIGTVVGLGPEDFKWKTELAK